MIFRRKNEKSKREKERPEKARKRLQRAVQKSASRGSKPTIRGMKNRKVTLALPRKLYPPCIAFI